MVFIIFSGSLELSQESGCKCPGNEYVKLIFTGFQLDSRNQRSELWCAAGLRLGLFLLLGSQNEEDMGSEATTDLEPTWTWLRNKSCCCLGTGLALPMGHDWKCCVLFLPEALRDCPVSSSVSFSIPDNMSLLAAWKPVKKTHGAIPQPFHSQNVLRVINNCLLL